MECEKGAEANLLEIEVLMKLKRWLREGFKN